MKVELVHEACWVSSGSRLRMSLVSVTGGVLWSRRCRWASAGTEVTG